MEQANAGKAETWRERMRACGLTCAKRVSRGVEYWSGDEAAVNRFCDMRDNDPACSLIPVLTCVYRGSGEDCIGVFVDRPAVPYVPENAALHAAAPELLAALRIAERELSWAVQQQCAGSSWANQDGATALQEVRKAIAKAGC